MTANDFYASDLVLVCKNCGVKCDDIETVLTEKRRHPGIRTKRIFWYCDRCKEEQE